MNAKLNKLRILALVGCVVIVLPAFLCGCNGEYGDSAYRQPDVIPPAPGRDAEDYYNQAVSHFEQGRYADAITAVKKAIVLKPDDADAYFFMGDAYSKLKQYPEAIAAFRKAIAIKPDFADAYCNMGDAYSKLKQYPEAIAAYRKCIALDPTGRFDDFARERISKIEKMDKP